MTKVTPYAQKAIPIILVNDQELGSFESTSHANSMGMHNEAASSNAYRLKVQSNFCEFNKTEESPRRECYHITCLYKRDEAKNSILRGQSGRNSENQESIASNLSLSSEKRIYCINILFHFLEMH